MTDFQKIVVYLAVVVAVAGAAVALGLWSLVPLVAGLSVLVIVVITAITLQVRRATSGVRVVTARVLSVSAIPASAGIKAACTMKLSMHLPGRGRVETKLRDPAVPLERWPSVGQAFPVEVYRNNPHRRAHIRWDLVEAGMVGAPAASAEAGELPDMIWENAEEPAVYSPTPPRRPRRTAPPPRQPERMPAPPLYEDFTDDVADVDAAPAGPYHPDPYRPDPYPADLVDARPEPGPGEPDLDEQTVRTGPHPTAYLGDVGDAATRRLPPPAGEANGHDPDGFDPADFEAPRVAPPRLEPMALPDFDPAQIDTRDFYDEPPAVTIPQPRDPSPPPPAPQGDETALPVSDLARSLHFYRDVLRFAVFADSADSAVVQSGTTRLRLETGTGTDDHPPGTVHVEVDDIETTCAELRARGIRLLQAPVATGGDWDGPQLWRARLRDPDGHDVELVEWRQRP